jgi:3-phosphoshikimate 1-carboxyvinyltransferase
MQRVIPQLPASKSISNRLLVINAFSGSVAKIDNLSTANDTVLLNQILKSHLSNPTSTITEINCEDAGTVMRFLTAYFSMQSGQWLLRGTDRMHQRPIKILVEKLKELGAGIKYLGEEGYPPLLINGKPLKGGEINIDASISSQYISALMMTAPYLTDGLQINLEGKLASLPYIKMTMGLMQQCGVDVFFEGDRITIKQGRYTSQQISVESDWSAASYWYAFVALKDDLEVDLKGLQKNSLQGDSIVAGWMENFGVKTYFTEDGVILRSIGETKSYFEQDFTNCPDLAPTFIALCAATNTHAKFYGVESLAIKESDRTKALATELNKLGVSFTQKQDYWELQPNSNLKEIPIPIEFNTYNDHRMAMALAMFKLVLPDVTVNNSEVVKKSYPNFWSDFEGTFNL